MKNQAKVRPVTLAALGVALGAAAWPVWAQIKNAPKSPVGKVARWPAGRVTFEGKATRGSSTIINGVPYVSAAGVAALAGLRMTYNYQTHTVDFSRPGAVLKDAIKPSGGSMQRNGAEGKTGELLVTPVVALRVDSVKVEEQFGKPYTIVRGKIRNTSQTRRVYTIGDAALVTKEGDTIKFFLKANEIGGESMVTLQKAEQTSLELTFPGAMPDATRTVITLQDWNNKINTVFRIQF